MFRDDDDRISTPVFCVNIGIVSRETEPIGELIGTVNFDAFGTDAVNILIASNGEGEIDLIARVLIEVSDARFRAAIT